MSGSEKSSGQSILVMSLQSNSSSGKSSNCSWWSYEYSSTLLYRWKWSPLNRSGLFGRINFMVYSVRSLLRHLSSSAHVAAVIVGIRLSWLPKMMP